MAVLVLFDFVAAVELLPPAALEELVAVVLVVRLAAGPAVRLLVVELVGEHALLPVAAVGPESVDFEQAAVLGAAVRPAVDALAGELAVGLAELVEELAAEPVELVVGPDAAAGLVARLAAAAGLAARLVVVPVAGPVA